MEPIGKAMQNAFSEVIKGENFQNRSGALIRDAFHFNVGIPELTGRYTPPDLRKRKKVEPGDLISEKLHEVKKAIPEKWQPYAGEEIVAKIEQGGNISGIEQGIVDLEAYINTFAGMGRVEVDDIDKARNAVNEETRGIGFRLGTFAGQVALLEKFKIQLLAEFYQVIGFSYFIQGFFKEARAVAVGKVEEPIDPFAPTAPAFNHMISSLKPAIGDYVAYQLTFSMLGYKAPMEHMLEVKNGMELSLGRLYTSIIEFLEVAPMPVEERDYLTKEMSLCFLSTEKPKKNVMAPMNWAYPTEERILEALSSIETEYLPLINTATLRAILNGINTNED